MHATKKLEGFTPELNLANVLNIYLYQSQIRLPTLGLKFLGNITRRPKPGVSLSPPEKDNHGHSVNKDESNINTN